MGIDTCRLRTTSPPSDCAARPPSPVSTGPWGDSRAAVAGGALGGEGGGEGAQPPPRGGGEKKRKGGGGCAGATKPPSPRGAPPRPPPPPPKPPRPPPPPPRRSPPPPAPGAFAFSTWMVRPSRLVPLSRLMACSASSGVAISTKPKPRDRPVSRSVTTLADSTLPAAAKASRRH